MPHLPRSTALTSPAPGTSTTSRQSAALRPAAAVVAGALALVLGTSALSQTTGTVSPGGGSGAGARSGAAAAAPQLEQRKLVDDFLHYVRIAKPDLAAASARRLFESGITDAELAELIDQNDLQSRVETALQYGRGMEGVSEYIADFESRLERGRRDLSRDPERIKQAVQMLVGTRRQQILAQGRLMEAGEYAVPELLRQVVEGRDPQLQLASADMLVAIRRQSVTPLVTALPNLDPTSQRRVAEILGAIAWPHATPYLLALAEDASAPGDVRSAAMQAFGAAGGTNLDLGQQWAQLARRYFDDEQSLIAFPGEPTNNIWGWDKFIGLVPTPVPTPVFSEIMAMKTSREALKVQPDNASALALFVASNLKRENQLPAGEIDPIFGEGPFTPQFYATAAGTRNAADVLALGMITYDTPLVRDAVGALRETGGRGNLSFDGTVAQPLVDSLQYPDRRVQYESAITLGSAIPKDGFSGDFAVVPTLASAVRAVGSEYAVVVTSDPEDRQVISNRLKALGYTVLNPGSSLSAIEADIAAAPGVDLLVIRGSEGFVREQLGAARTSRKLLAVPVVAIAGPADKIRLDRDLGTDRRVQTWIAGGTDEQFQAAVEQVVERTTGGRITEAESMQYAAEALETLEKIALSGTEVYRVSDAQSALLEALEKRSGGLRLLVADVLAVTPTDEAQRRLLDAALAAAEGEQVELLDRVAASARRFGNRAEPRQINALLALIESSAGPVADAAARVHGAMNLPPANAVKLIVR